MTQDDIVRSPPESFQARTEHRISDLHVQTKQEKGETIYQYYSKLKNLAKACNYDDIIHGCMSHKLRIKALSDPTLDLAKILATARAMELTESQATKI